MPPEPVSPELALVDPELRLRLQRQALAELLLERLGAGDPPPSLRPALLPAAVESRGRRSVSRARLVPVAVTAALVLVLPSLAFLPPRNAPTLDARSPALYPPQTISWQVDPSARYYLFELFSGRRRTSAVWTRTPSVTLDSRQALPGRYWWRVRPAPSRSAAGLAGPIASGTITLG